MSSTPSVVRLPGSRPTQRDVARLAGVSQTTVSQVLTARHDRLSESTRQRVLAALDELGYTPNALARGLRGARTALLGVIARDLTQPSIVMMITALIREARSRGYEVLVADTGESAPAALDLAALMKHQLCDGVLLVGDVHDEQLLWDGYGQVGLPAVGLLQGSRDLPIANVSVDNVAGATIALEHLAGLGHSRVAFIGAGWIHGSSDRRQVFEEFRQAMNLSEEPGYLVEAENSPQGGVKALERLLALEVRPTAVFAATDLIAMGVLAQAHRAGVAVPDELSVIGFDDAPQSAFLAPALTTVRQPLEELAREAIAVLAEGTATMVAGAAHRLVAPTLSVRASTGNPKVI